MSVRYRRDRKHWQLNAEWPDGIRTRKSVPSKEQANKLDVRIKASCVDGTWKELRRRLFVSLDVPEGMPTVLSSKNLPIREFEIPHFPPCIYFLCLGEEVVYVGQSVGLARRIIDHSEDDRKLFDRVFYMLVPKKHLSKIEARFICELQPKLNRLLLNGEKQ